MMRIFVAFLTLALFISGIKCELDEKEMDDLESDMVISLKKFKKSKDQEEALRSKLCARNLKADEWTKFSIYCFDRMMANAKCAKCKEVFARTYDFCNKKVPYTDGCNEVTFNRRGACSMEVFEKNRSETLLAFKENKEEFLEMIRNMNECFKKIIDEEKWDIVK